MELLEERGNKTYTITENVFLVSYPCSRTFMLELWECSEFDSFQHPWVVSHMAHCFASPTSTTIHNWGLLALDPQPGHRKL